jgi:hypothetical protein
MASPIISFIISPPNWHLNLQCDRLSELYVTDRSETSLSAAGIGDRDLIGLAASIWHHKIDSQIIL